jgi:hypothetical protein
MARKKFEEVEYDPIEAEAKRALARQISQPAMSPLATFGNAAVKEEPLETVNVQSLREPVRPVPPLPTKAEAPLPARKQKKRSFSCANAELDAELDAFLLRIQETARTHVPFQVLMRAACTAMMGAEEQIVAEMKKSPPSPYPATFAHAEYGQFEDYWIEVMGKALRKARPPSGS